MSKIPISAEALSQLFKEWNSVVDTLISEEYNENECKTAILNMGKHLREINKEIEEYIDKEHIAPVKQKVNTENK